MKIKLLRQNNVDTLKLSNAIWSFCVKTFGAEDSDTAYASTIDNILTGYMVNPKLHNTWIIGDVDGYCLCRVDRDYDGKLVYTAYQLWIDPKKRNWQTVHKLMSFLRFYAQKQGYSRLYVISSRLDKIKAYSRGLGKRFKVSSVNFVDNIY